MKVCGNCKLEKLETQFYSYKYSKDRLRYNCKDCCKNQQKQRVLNNPKQQTEYTNTWVKNNKDRFRKTNNLRYKIRYNSEENFKLQVVLRARLRSALKQKKWNKNSKLNKYLGCTIPELKIYLETKFLFGMTRENHTYNGWHIDHIVPLDSAKTKEEMYNLCHYTNLQPLWAIDNLKKGSKVA